MKYDEIEYSLGTEDVFGITLYTKEECKLPIYMFKDGMSDIEIDINANIYDVFEMENDKDATVRELLEEYGFIVDYDNEYIFYKDGLEEIDHIHCYYSNSDMVSSTTYFYKINDELFCVNPCDDNNYYVWEDVKEMVIENASYLEIWHQGGEELKEIVFGDMDILDVVKGDGEEEFFIVDYVGLTERNPAYSFEYIGITEEKELVLFSKNNCNVTVADRPFGEKIDICDAIKRNIGAVEETISDEDLEIIINFWLQNK